MANDVQLSLQDIAFVAKIIDAATQRGAIRAEEMEEVGGVYKRLVAVVEAYQPQEQEDTENTQDPQ